MISEDETNEWDNLLLIHKFALKAVDTKLNILNEDFQFLHLHNPIEHIKSRVKSLQSIAQKLARRGLEVTVENAKNNIFDIAGVRIICSFTSDIYAIYHLLKNQSDVNIIEVEDYIKNPKPNGYQSLHMLAEIPVFLSNRSEQVTVEIQIRTIAMDFWASLEHKIFYKFNKSVPDDILYELKQCASMVTLLDEKMLNIKNDIARYK
jgi:putative GTP pyrophosphokinase